jgi:signal transduction histidine kinase
MVAVCTYSLGQCEAAEIVDVANAHQLALVGKRREWRLVKNAERKRAQQRARQYQAQLKSLALQSSLAEERERRRIATELHDRIGQSLAVSKVKLDALRHSVLSGEPGEVLEEVCNSLGQAITDVRSLTSDLSSPVLHELGFESAVAAWLAEQIEAKHDIATEFEDDGQPKPLADDVRGLLFRNVRELLINIVRHANARKVKVSVRTVDDRIQVSVQDDGIGFEPAEALARAAKAGGFGLFSIKERLEQIGGHLELESRPGHGCKVTMTAPLKQG